MAADSWEVVANMPEPRSDHGAVAVGDRHIYVTGGMLRYDDIVDDIVDSMLRYDVAMDVWEEVASLPTPRCGLAAVALGDSVLVFGGFDVDEDFTYFDTAARYSTVSNVWEEMPPMLTA